jgi:hypothetical protein
MAVTRRLLLTGAAITVLGGGVVWRAVNQGVFSGGTGPAYEPWRVDGEPGPLRLVRAAILGASPHNTQPWLFRVREASVDVWADTRRHIGTIDPYLREMYVGVGCALENLLIAAAREGYAAVLTLMPNAADPAHAAHVALTPAAPAESALYAAIPRRHTNRGPYDTARAVPGETLSAMAQLGPDLPDVKVLWFDRGPDRKRIGDAIVSATEAIIADRQQSQDSARWFRASWQDLQRHRDGITLDAQGLPPVVNALAKMLPAVSPERADAAWLEATRDRHVATAAAFGILAVPDTRDAQMRLRGGRMWQRMHLWATTRGLAMQPLNQLAERADRERQLALTPTYTTVLGTLIDGSGLEALMPFRIGYSVRDAGLSPRRDVEAVLVRAA